MYMKYPKIISAIISAMISLPDTHIGDIGTAGFVLHQA